MLDINIILLGVIGFIISIVLGKVTIKKLHEFKFGQSIREEGPKSHLIKSGTPTMGGIIFLLSFFILLLINFKFDYSFLILFISIYGLGIIGLIDDIKIVINKSNDGISPMQKIVGQLLVATIISVVSYIFIGSDIFVPFLDYNISIGYFYIPFNIFFIVALSNSVNLTDGIDGLSTSITILVLMFLLVLSIIIKNYNISGLILGLIGALFGFLYFNWNPAKVFMGDVGSLALGGAVAAFAIILKIQLLIPFIGVVYFMETLSVIIQVLYFKKTGKRVFKMTPIHHHFELSGFKEVQIVRKFSLYTVVGFIISLLLFI